MQNDNSLNVSKRWAFHITCEHRAGVTNAIAAMFSGRGLQFDGFYGCGDELDFGTPGKAKIIVIFRSFESRMRQMSLLVSRLQHVQQVDCLAWGDLRLQRQLLLQIEGAVPKISKEIKAFSLGDGRYLLSAAAGLLEQELLLWQKNINLKIESSSYTFSQ